MNLMHYKTYTATRLNKPHWQQRDSFWCEHARHWCKASLTTRWSNLVRDHDVSHRPLIVFGAAQILESAPLLVSTSKL